MVINEELTYLPTPSLPTPCLLLTLSFYLTITEHCDVCTNLMLGRWHHSPGIRWPCRARGCLGRALGDISLQEGMPTPERGLEYGGKGARLRRFQGRRVGRVKEGDLERGAKGRVRVGLGKTGRGGASKRGRRERGRKGERRSCMGRV